ncbi:DNA-binding transcriptional regulator DhaR [Providencia sneebia DSM 19967]|uniref:DNA-binding transcriptional regulator DhaR n=1 Tax=Providencia sneebia DSM 19967 TaxID=1141660 RepID=K8WDE2_9GAMM|nr:DNA-binding transcriptional regulator DhaR [Providencia sneebia DSM 19967]
MEHRELSIQEVEKSAIIEAARVCRGKIQDMYQVLNMGRTTLWRKLKQYDIDIKDYK